MSERDNLREALEEMQQKYERRADDAYQNALKLLRVTEGDFDAL